MTGEGGGMCGRGVCMARGHAWQGVCMAVGVCMARGHAWQERWPLQPEVCILLEYILVGLC